MCHKTPGFRSETKSWDFTRIKCCFIYLSLKGGGAIKKLRDQYYWGWDGNFVALKEHPILFSYSKIII